MESDAVIDSSDDHTEASAKEDEVEMSLARMKPRRETRAPVFFEPGPDEFPVDQQLQQDGFESPVDDWKPRRKRRRRGGGSSGSTTRRRRRNESYDRSEYHPPPPRRGGRKPTGRPRGRPRVRPLPDADAVDDLQLHQAHTEGEFDRLDEDAEHLSSTTAMGDAGRSESAAALGNPPPLNASAMASFGFEESDHDDVPMTYEDDEMAAATATESSFAASGSGTGTPMDESGPREESEDAVDQKSELRAVKTEILAEKEESEAPQEPEEEQAIDQKIVFSPDSASPVQSLPDETHEAEKSVHDYEDEQVEEETDELVADESYTTAVELESEPEHEPEHVPENDFQAFEAENGEELPEQEIEVEEAPDGLKSESAGAGDENEEQQVAYFEEVEEEEGYVDQDQDYQAEIDYPDESGCAEVQFIEDGVYLTDEDGVAQSHVFVDEEGNSYVYASVEAAAEEEGVDHDQDEYVDAEEGHQGVYYGQANDEAYVEEEHAEEVVPDEAEYVIADDHRLDAVEDGEAYEMDEKPAEEVSDEAGYVPGQSVIYHDPEGEIEAEEMEIETLAYDPQNHLQMDGYDATTTNFLQEDEIEVQMADNNAEMAYNEAISTESMEYAEDYENVAAATAGDSPMEQELEHDHGPSSSASMQSDEMETLFIELKAMNLLIGNDLVTIPEILLQNEKLFRSVINFSSYMSILPENREYLRRFLPKNIDSEVDMLECAHDVLESDSKFYFGSPVNRALNRLCQGYFSPKHCSNLRQIQDNRRVWYDHFIRRYHMRLLRKLLIVRHTVLELVTTTPIHEPIRVNPVQFCSIKKRNKRDEARARARLRSRILINDAVGKTPANPDDLSSDESDIDLSLPVPHASAYESTVFYPSEKCLDLDMYRPLQARTVSQIMAEFKAHKRKHPNCPSFDISGITLEGVYERCGLSIQSERNFANMPEYGFERPIRRRRRRKKTTSEETTGQQQQQALPPHESVVEASADG